MAPSWIRFVFMRGVVLQNSQSSFIPAVGADVSVFSATESHHLGYFSYFSLSTVVTLYCVEYRKEIISFLKKG